MSISQGQPYQQHEADAYACDVAAARPHSFHSLSLSEQTSSSLRPAGLASLDGNLSLDGILIDCGPEAYPDYPRNWVGG